MAKNTHRVLVIDDDPDACFFIRELLGDVQSFTTVVDAAHNSQDALSALDKSKYDLVLLDQNLGPGTGLDMIPAIQDTGHLGPIIMMSGFQNKDFALRAQDAGAVDYIIKSNLNSDLLDRTFRLAWNLNPPGAASSSDSLMREVINLNRKFVEATTSQAQAIGQNTSEIKILTSSMGEGISGLRKDLALGLTAVNLQVQTLHQQGVEHMDRSTSVMEQTRQTIAAELDKANKHLVVKVLDWIKENRALALGIAVALLILILVAVLVSQTLNANTINQLREGKYGTPAAASPK